MTPSSRFILTASALVLAAYGGALLFIPEHVMAAYGVSEAAPFFAQHLGLALFGLATVNRLARTAPVGGIYGRPIVTGNLVHFGAVFMLHLGHMIRNDVPLGVWVGLLLSGVLTAAFAILLFGDATRS